MNAHELARKLLEGPDVPVVISYEPGSISEEVREVSAVTADIYRTWCGPSSRVVAGPTVDLS